MIIRSLKFCIIAWFKRVFLFFGLSVRRTPLKEHFQLYKRYIADEVLLQRPFVNIGAGDFSHPFWTRVDLESPHYHPRGFQEDTFNIGYDLMSMEPIPLQSEFAKIIYSSHCIEHVSDYAVLNMFKEAYRVLSSHGLFRLTCPDFDLAYNALIRNDRDFFSFYADHHSTDTHTLFLRLVNTPSSRMRPSVIRLARANRISPQFKEYLLYGEDRPDFDYKSPGDHINSFNYHKLSSFLRRAGFKRVYKSSYLQSRSCLLRCPHFFDNTHPGMSLYIEAFKN